MLSILVRKTELESGRPESGDTLTLQPRLHLDKLLYFVVQINPNALHHPAGSSWAICKG